MILDAGCFSCSSVEVRKSIRIAHLNRGLKWSGRDIGVRGCCCRACPVKETWKMEYP